MMITLTERNKKKENDGRFCGCTHTKYIRAKGRNNVYFSLYNSWVIWECKKQQVMKGTAQWKLWKKRTNKITEKGTKKYGKRKGDGRPQGRNQFRTVESRLLLFSAMFFCIFLFTNLLCSTNPNFMFEFLIHLIEQNESSKPAEQNQLPRGLQRKASVFVNPFWVRCVMQSCCIYRCLAFRTRWNTKGRKEDLLRNV